MITLFQILCLCILFINILIGYKIGKRKGYQQGYDAGYFSCYNCYCLVEKNIQARNKKCKS
jgi:hypothetical protein